MSSPSGWNSLFASSPCPDVAPETSQPQLRGERGAKAGFVKWIVQGCSLRICTAGSQKELGEAGEEGRSRGSCAPVGWGRMGGREQRAEGLELERSWEEQLPPALGLLLPEPKEAEPSVQLSLEPAGTARWIQGIQGTWAWSRSPAGGAALPALPLVTSKHICRSLGKSGLGHPSVGCPSARDHGAPRSWGCAGTPRQGCEGQGCSRNSGEERESSAPFAA